MTKLISITRLIFLLIIVIFFFPSTYSFALIDEIGISSFRRSVNKILSNPCLRKNNYGIKIYSLDRGETLYEFGNNKLLIPASNIKIITTAVALKYLGGNYRFSTKIFTDGILENQVLKGNLYIKGSGDPKLVTEQLWLLVNELRHLHAHRKAHQLFDLLHRNPLVLIHLHQFYVLFSFSPKVCETRNQENRLYE